MMGQIRRMGLGIWGVLALALAAAGAEEAAVKREIAPGKFEPTQESLKQYQCPEWFRDAKFGIWAHWGAQCVPAMGDWYARSMYLQGNPDYEFHVQHYGHPSVFGFKDIYPLWKAEKWDPEKLIALYKRAGAHYFVAMANHHDNFDAWNSKWQPWNSVNLGPKKDLIGGWGAAARAAGLRFGVTVHAARAWTWYEVAQMSDKTGDKAGVPYDGNLTKADGKGKWWEGYDPQDLYAQRHKPGDIQKRGKDGSGDPPSQAYIDKFFNRIKDLIDQHDPDLVYFDDSKPPLGEAGMNLAAHYYNANMARRAGKLEAVLNTKGLDEDWRKTMVWDIERGKAKDIEPYPWQTDTCIGTWHYKEGVNYKTADQVIDMLIDIVSKNGNLLLNIPVRGDGSIDEREVAILETLAKWTGANGEGIYGTRPWKVYGEGPDVEGVKEAGRFGGESDTRKAPYTGADMRFTTRDGAVYVYLLAPPAGDVKVKSLGKNAATKPGTVAGVALLGSKDKVEFEQSEEALTIEAPGGAPCPEALCYKVTF